MNYSNLYDKITYTTDDYDKLNFTIKDCLYGQIRAIGDNVYREYDVPGQSFPIDIPNNLARFVTNQQIITWDNVTGMNPLYAQSPLENTMYKSYGNMLVEMYALSESLGLTYIPDLLEKMDAKGYEDVMRSDHKSDYAMMGLTIGWWWHVHQLLNAPDALDYDYLTVRQTDTWYWPKLNKKRVYELFVYAKQKILGNNNHGKIIESKIPLHDIPVMYCGRWRTRHFPIATSIHSSYFIFNKATVKLIQKDFIANVLKEIEFYYKMTGKYSSSIRGKPGILMHNIAIKNNITPIDTTDNTFIWIPTGRSPATDSYSRNERNIHRVDL